MLSLGTSNPVLSVLQIKPEDKIIAIRENANADSNFILTYLIKQIFSEKNKLCLVSLHNTLDHYQEIGRKLGYDLLKVTKDNDAKVIEPIKDIVENIGYEGNYLQDDKENIVKCLYIDIQEKIEDLLADNNKQVYLIVDDLSHLLDLGINVNTIACFVNYCVNMIDNERIRVVLNNHVSSKIDEILSNNLQYIADIHVEVSGLKTGWSNDVTGSLTVERLSGKSQYQYKAYDRGIRTFHPGESIFHMYK